MRLDFDKCSLPGLPLGGLKGGVICNTKEMNIGELERLNMGYIWAIADFIGPEIGGSKGGSKSTSLGGTFALREAALEHKIDLKTAAIAVQGFGNVGFNAAKLIPEKISQSSL